MLAGRLKLRNFVIVAVLALGLCGVGTTVVVVFGLSELGSSVALEEGIEKAGGVPVGPTTVVTVPAAPVADLPIQTSANAPNPNIRAWDKVVFDNQGRDLGGDKLKDVSKGQSWKVNLYQDAGSKTMNRAKVDLDRDDKWDEKYTLEEGKVLRQVAPADDENYTESYLWSGTAWVRE